MLRRALLALSVAVAAGCLSTRGPTAPAGKPAPDFTLKSHDGRDVSLASLTQSGPVVVVFYRGFW